MAKNMSTRMGRYSAGRLVTTTSPTLCGTARHRLNYIVSSMNQQIIWKIRPDRTLVAS